MHELYAFVTGPAAWGAVLIFMGGVIIKLSMIVHLTLKKDPQILKVLNLKFSVYSLFRWIIPFATVSSRKNPITTLVNSAFHGLLFLTPLLAVGHAVMIERAFGIRWPSLPDRVVDVMTVLFIACCLFLMIRRVIKKEVRFVTSFSDWVLLLLIALPFVTGFLAYHQLFHYQAMMILHMISGEVLLVLIPVTRLSHMFYAVFTRAHTASEFGVVRHARDW